MCVFDSVHALRVRPDCFNTVQHCAFQLTCRMYTCRAKPSSESYSVQLCRNTECARMLWDKDLVAGGRLCQRSLVSFQLQRSAISCKKTNVRVHRAALHCAALQCTAWHCALALNPITGTQTLDCLRSPALWCILGADLGTLFKHIMCSYVVGQGCECQH